MTWLTKLLSGENSCEWATWFRARHESGSWEQVPGDFDRAGRQNHFALRGGAGTLGGQPDLVARMGETGAIIDAKTGKPSPSHLAQVILYMYAVPRAIGRRQGVVFDGQVACADYVVDIPASAVDDRFMERLSQLIGRLASDAPVRKIPSPGECRFCPITAGEPFAIGV